jgi:hypothetical protein
MNTHRQIRLALAALLLAVASAFAVNEAPTRLPQPGPRSRVHVVLIDGFDPAHMCHFDSIVAKLHSWGYKNDHYYQWRESDEAADRIRAIRAEEPQARIVLVGYSRGSITARNVANAVQGEGIQIDLLVYLGADLLKDSPRNCPGNALHIVNVRGWGYLPLAGGLVHGADLAGAENYDLRTVAHRNLPTNPSWLDLLHTRLDGLDTQAPVVQAGGHRASLAKAR